MSGVEARSRGGLDAVLRLVGVVPVRSADAVRVARPDCGKTLAGIGGLHWLLRLHAAGRS